MECGKCRFFNLVGAIPDRYADRFGECRRFPPRPDGKGVHTVDEFPTVKSVFWCGEYKKGTKK